MRLRIPPVTREEELAEDLHWLLFERRRRCCDKHHGEGCADSDGYTCCPDCPFGHRTEKIGVRGWPYRPTKPQRRTP